MLVTRDDVMIVSAILYCEPHVADGALFLASLNVRVGPFLVLGAQLGRRTRDGGLFLQMPSNGRKRRVVFADRETRFAVMAAARDAYVALGGPTLHGLADMPLATAPELMESIA